MTADHSEAVERGAKALQRSAQRHAKEADSWDALSEFERQEHREDAEAVLTAAEAKESKETLATADTDPLLLARKEILILRVENERLREERDHARKVADAWRERFRAALSENDTQNQDREAAS